jgi:UDP-N-acetylglucosamine 2-epimerase (non-hydrolysing)
LVGTGVVAIFNNVNEFLTNNKVYEKMAFAHNPYGTHNPYGNCQACQRIVDRLASLNK